MEQSYSNGLSSFSFANLNRLCPCNNEEYRLRRGLKKYERSALCKSGRVANRRCYYVVFHFFDYSGVSKTASFRK